ncbi:hypothetical protein [Pseudoduganella chitinolytica]|uniref:PKD domain-containing protein n=1 Tax=Pseudoduganella chitinolytica TaxID=34070 RepID=A0ABY8B8A9_9BURK|nr:hypothetical protein [Pseudoduganella chitinolytica]WEF31236.1 hypothetical protein PX653_17420 [Pseudoduganella chitinolytica]
MKTLQTLTLGTLVTLLAGCGGGSDSDSATGTLPPPAPPVTLTLSSTTLRTLPGGAGIAVTAASSGTGAIQWKLADGAPGTLSGTTGTSVTYNPPANGIAKTTLVPIVATSGGTSTTLTVAVTPDPGPSGLTLLAGHAAPESVDGVGAAASFFYPRRIAADTAGNVFVLEHYTSRPSLPTPGRLRKIAPDGTVTTLIGGSDPQRAWFGQADTANNARRFAEPTSLVVDHGGNFYYGNAYGFGGSSSMGGSSLLKITPTGVLSVLAGAETTASTGIADGTGTAARFMYPDAVGIDYDDVIYVQDLNNVARKVTTAGVVTTISAIPRSLQADMNGNTYTYDATARTLVQTSPAGTKTVVAGAPSCTGFKPGPLPGCLPNVQHMVVAGGSTLVLLGDGLVVKLVLPH